jgi:hypothetical protein
MVVINSKLKLTCFAALVLLFFNTVSSADLVDPTLVFKMSADKTALLPNEETMVHIWAWIYTPTGIEKPDNGLDTWQLDLRVDTTNVIEIVSLDVLAPSPRNPAYPPYNPASLNTPITGEVRRVAVIQLEVGAPSLTGVGIDNDIDNPTNYSEICNFTIKAIGAPLTSASYTIMNDGGGGWFGILTDGTEFDNDSPTAYGGTYFYASGSDHVFTIITPEPATVVLLAIASVFALRRRK